MTALSDSIILIMKHSKPSENCKEIQLDINFMGIELESSCGYDFFQIAWPNADAMETTRKFCGFSNAYQNDTFSGNEFPEDGLTINSSEFQFRWLTDYSVIDEGLELTWTCSGQKIPKIDPCDLRKASIFFNFVIFKNVLSG